jgi:hypothetical protein
MRGHANFKTNIYLLVNEWCWVISFPGQGVSSSEKQYLPTTFNDNYNVEIYSLALGGGQGKYWNILAYTGLRLRQHYQILTSSFFCQEKFLEGINKKRKLSKISKYKLSKNISLEKNRPVV